MQKITLPAKLNGSNIPASLDKRRQRDSLIVVASHRGKLKEIATLRTYSGIRAPYGRNYCSLFIHADSHYGNGYGEAGRYGYHRPSAAANNAFRSAGIALAEPIDGRGDSAMCEAMEALARALGFRKFIVVRS